MIWNGGGGGGGGGYPKKFRFEKTMIRSYSVSSSKLKMEEISS